MKLITHLGRPLDPRYPTNRVIRLWVVLIFFAMFGFRLLTGEDVFQAGIQAVSASLSIFFVWAFAREIDPQEQLSAFVAVLFMTIAVFLVDVQFNLLVLFYLMMMTRIINRTFGLPAKLSDSILLLIVTGVVALIGNWIYAVIGIIAFLLDSLLPQADSKHRLFAALSLVIMAVAFVLQNAQINPTLPTSEYLLAIALIAVIFIPLILKSKFLATKMDIGNEQLLPIRVQTAQVIALSIAFLFAFWLGNEGILKFLPLWLTIAGVSLFPLIKPFVPDWSLDKVSRSRDS